MDCVDKLAIDSILLYYRWSYAFAYPFRVNSWMFQKLFFGFWGSGKNDRADTRSHVGPLPPFFALPAYLLTRGHFLSVW